MGTLETYFVVMFVPNADELAALQCWKTEKST
jgi:hypothetical protein